MKLIYRLFLSFLLVVLLLGGIGGMAGVWLINDTVFREAQYRTDLDLRSAREQLDQRLERVRLVLETAATRQPVRELLTAGGDADRVRLLLERDRAAYRLDVLGLVDARGDVQLRARKPSNGNGNRATDPLVARALKGEAETGFVVLYPGELSAEHPDLAGEAYINIRATEQARPRPETAVDRGLMLWSAVPVRGDNGEVVGALYGGVMVNRNWNLVDDIRNVVFGDDIYKGRNLGTVTVFLGDVRVTTNVRDAAGNRAVGTRVSAAVYDRVLESGERWYDRAFVVNDWYISAYEPIRDPDGKVVGILYTGIMEAKYADQRNRIIWSFVGLLVLGVLVATALSLALARSIARPIDELERASERLAEGDLDYRPKHYKSVTELEGLSESFRKMAENMSGRDMKLREQNVELEEANVRLTQLNAAYMDMLGFVSHELKNPLNSMIFGASSIRDELVGPLSPEQKKIMDTVIRNAEYLEEMIANYLDLSRIEKGELEVRKRPTKVATELVEPILTQMQNQIDKAKMAVRLEVSDDLEVPSDPGMLRIVLDNLLSNAVKYGREGGLIEIRAREDGDAVELSVRNDGEGITPEGLKKLFGKFVRLDQPAGRYRKGTGLGLFVSREIVERHGGQIHAESEPGEWVRFVVRLPAVNGNKAVGS